MASLVIHKGSLGYAAVVEASLALEVGHVPQQRRLGTWADRPEVYSRKRCPITWDKNWAILPGQSCPGLEP